jgi:hypothetical protein
LYTDTTHKLAAYLAYIAGGPGPAGNLAAAEGALPALRMRRALDRASAETLAGYSLAAGAAAYKYIGFAMH